MARSESIAKLLPALIAARGAMEKVIKDAVNPAFKTAEKRDGSSYATLAACIEACEPALGKHGLAVLQTTRWAEGFLTLDTVLAHDSGEWISSEYPVLCDYGRPQQIGGALTYARRYCYLAITGRAPEDDDGNAASGHGQAAQPQPQRRESEVSRRNRESHEGPRGGPACNQRGYDRSSNGPGANGNGKSNGHTNGVVVAPAAPVAAAEPDDSRSPMTRGGLRRWATEIERTYGEGVMAHIAAHAAKLGWPKSSAQWTSEQIEASYQDARDSLELIYPDYRDGESDADAGDDGRYDDRMEH